MYHPRTAFALIAALLLTAAPAAASANLIAEASGEVVDGAITGRIIDVEFASGSRPVRMLIEDDRGATYILQDHNPWEGRRDDSLKRFAAALLRAFESDRRVELIASFGVLDRVRVSAPGSPRRGPAVIPAKPADTSRRTGYQTVD